MGVLPAEEIQEVGTYTIFYAAAGDDGFGVDLPAEPVARFVRVRGNAALDDWQLYE